MNISDVTLLGVSHKARTSYLGFSSIVPFPKIFQSHVSSNFNIVNEYQALSQGLTLIRRTISLVNDRVREYEKAVRLREIALRLEPKSQGRMKDGQLFRREDLIQDNRSLLHEGTVTWKSSSKQKGLCVLAVLLTDVLLLLQEKDQKLAFAAVDNKPPVISLQGLIVREVAHEDKAMFLISAFTSSLPEMYEIRTGSREERNTWTAQPGEAEGVHKVCRKGEGASDAGEGALGTVTGEN
uniref:PH domain-containing protein n=1 Tax=Monopterus albus TaxID=43700 RepID=A0A3Q3KD19_MONAL